MALVYDDIPLWDTEPSEIEFKPSYSVAPPRVGKSQISTLSPFWKFSFQIPGQALATRIAIETLLNGTEGVKPLRFYDSRHPYPDAVKDEVDPDAATLALTLSATSIADSTISVSGTATDVITEGDPLAFTFEGKRHYYKAAETIILTAGTNVLSVYMRPRYVLSGESITVERVRPTLAFDFDINAITQTTGVDKYTSYDISGIEHLHNFFVEVAAVIPQLDVIAAGGSSNISVTKSGTAPDYEAYEAGVLDTTYSGATATHVFPAGADNYWKIILPADDPLNVTELDFATALLEGAMIDLTIYTNLTSVTIRDNAFTGTLPAFTGLTSLVTFHADTNSFSGAIPDMSDLTSCSQFYVHVNNLTGAIPALTGLTAMTVMRVNTNSLSGDIPTLAGLTALTDFRAYTNDFSGVPAGWACESALDDIQLQVCDITTVGDIDAFYAELNASAGSNGIAKTSGGTNVDPTGGASNSDVVALAADGWTITL